jgi:hypothetical protein
MIQELKVEDFKLGVASEYILSTFKSIITFSNNGRGGTALLIHPKLTIVNLGTTTNGLAWATIKVGR